MGRPYDRRRWRRLSSRILTQRPTCEHAGCQRPATEVHHVDGLGPAGPRGYDPTNLLALCTPHHAATTAAARVRARTRGPEPHPGLIEGADAPLRPTA